MATSLLASVNYNDLVTTVHTVKPSVPGLVYLLDVMEVTYSFMTTTGTSAQANISMTSSGQAIWTDTLNNVGAAGNYSFNIERGVTWGMSGGLTLPVSGDIKISSTLFSITELIWNLNLYGRCV